MLDIILYDCETCKLFPNCDFYNGIMELKGSCIGYKCDIDLVTKEIIKIAENENTSISESGQPESK